MLNGQTRQYQAKSSMKTRIANQYIVYYKHVGKIVKCCEMVTERLLTLSFLDYPLPQLDCEAENRKDN